MSDIPDNTNGSIVFDRAVGYYDQTRGFPPGIENVVPSLFIQAGQLTESSRVLEVGIGTGRIALPLASHVRSYTGIDLSRLMMSRLLAKQGDETVYLSEGDASQLPFGNHVFDAAIAVHVFHLIPTWQIALREVARVLRPGGLLLHGGDNGMGRHQAFRVLAEALNAAVPERPQRGVQNQNRTTFLVDSGWTPVGEPVRHEFSVKLAPQSYLDQLAARTWSSTWQLTDEELTRGLEAVRAAITRHFGDPQTLIPSQAHFEVQAYAPPRQSS